MFVALISKEDSGRGIILRPRWHPIKIWFVVSAHLMTWKWLCLSVSCCFDSNSSVLIERDRGQDYANGEFG